mmetsp:Transcript_61140/g.71113  ORF Transcript_61140/g.71113 Transcript_61140/m.71113 type:complete len:651 (-) Transcript_61140:503-2455(-)|eukprot:CAMPEP_0176406106 /NCGR_PEP_ID=MMETSP0127-20121128/694_1 /TAXON_ID=938130 /ORGANISM="Platyophrya macrostoma, Strain WH" /LENGTH=650 /DNA_ID=CAMNT_0017785209 /DNA_START=36 /DNA_END=1988 /DNA_ORIENTATION=-
MGCGASAEKPANQSGDGKKGGAEKKKAASGDDSGKSRYLGDLGAAVGVVEDKKLGQIVLVAFVAESGNTTFASYATGGSRVFLATFSDDEFASLKESQNVSMSMNAVYKSIVTECLKGKLRVNVQESSASATFNVTSVKDAKAICPLTVTMEAVAQDINAARVQFIIGPVTRMVQKKRTDSEDKEKELKLSRLMTQSNVWQINVQKNKLVVERIQKVILPLREQSAQQSKVTAESSAKIEALERRIKRLQGTHGSNSGKPLLDRLYEEGGAIFFSHLPDAEEHHPVHRRPDEFLLNWIRSDLPLKEGVTLATLSKCPSDPQLAPLLNSENGKLAQDAMNVFAKLDQWDMSVFELEKATGGLALFTTAYAILYKLGLVTHFGIDDTVLRNFLMAVQAGYHPNAYHNSTHAADVTQVNYFIITQGGIIDKCKLSKEELLAAVIAGAIHDYDHPGYNNNFHTRTNAYLSTLYNDRSILENHHCACVTEILKLPQYNFLAVLSEDQRRTVRDTMLEMVLATDMGNHAKIFSSFRRRMAECPEWHEKKDDIYLALSMSIKMADISNCGRPKFLYLEWAKNIAGEFYFQGDAEERRNLSISPFMDRKKDKTDFPKGQISFMNYVVVPMFEAIAEFLPPVEVALQFCTENKEYWQQQ